MGYLDLNGLQKVKAHIENLLFGKVDKVEGKQLSTNDYTNEEKSKLSSLENAVAITSERIAEICGIEPIMTLIVNEDGNAILNAGWPDDNGNIQI